jgi:flagellar protein FlaG
MKMTTPVAPPATTPDLSGAVARRSSVEDVAVSAATAKPAPASNDAASVEPPADFDTRLVIEEDKATKTFIYKTLDRRTGEVLQQFPREQVLRLHQEPGYQPGSVLRART